MKRKLCSIFLGLFAVVLLMGADIQRDADSVIVNVKAADTVEAAQPAEGQTEVVIGQSDIGLDEATAFDPADWDMTILVDRAPVLATTNKTVINGTTYVNLGAMAQAMDATATLQMDGATATVTTEQLTITAEPDTEYLVANGRYLYAPTTIREMEGAVMVPLSILVKAFSATIEWDSDSQMTYITSGTEVIASADAVYNDEDLFWLARVIYAESGNQSMSGRIAVGNVIMNRIDSAIFPDSVLGVIAQKNQFTTYDNGKLANRTPNEGSVIAAKLVLDGAICEETEGAYYFDTGSSSTWAARNKNVVTVLGGHTFYDI